MSGDANTLNQDEEAAFAAGFDDTTATPTETPAEQQDEDTLHDEGTTATAEPAAPEYAQLTKAQLDDLLAIKAMQEKQFGTAFGKIGGIERTLQQLNSGAQVDISQEDIDALKDDFPPLAAALEKVRSLRALPGGRLDQDELDELLGQRLSQREEERQEREQRRELRRLRRAHPDWKQIDADPAFAEWVKAQSDEFKEDLADASATYDASMVSEAMTLFKQSRKAAPTADRATAWKSRAAAAVTPRGSGGATAGDSTDPFLSGFNSD
jgi:hypothetical protein